MSAPSQGRGSGHQQFRGSQSNTTRGRGSIRGSRSSSERSRGRGRGTTTGPNKPNTAASEAGPRPAGSSRASIRSRGQRFTTRGTTNRGRSTSSSVTATLSEPPSTTSRTSSPAPGAVDPAEVDARIEHLRPLRELERQNAIRNGLIADPEKKTTLDKAITPVGTCTEMCPEWERLRRIKELATDPAERIPSVGSGRPLPSEERMVKRFRRSAAGNEEQLPSDIRTPETLQKSLDYLFDKIIGGSDRLVQNQKFVWDRTRAIRNDFSIQQVTKTKDVEIAVECYERIARFHILSLHQLSNKENLQEGEHFDAHQEREQLNNTLLSLMYYYDDNRHHIYFPHEAEFKAYCILFELQSLTPDLEDRLQSWPSEILNDRRIQVARKIYAAAGNTEFNQGPLQPLIPFAMAQANAGKFWTLLESPKVSYMMACVAEMSFSMVRFTGLNALWRSAKSAPEKSQKIMKSWTLSALTAYLGFDDGQQTLDFCYAFEVSFRDDEEGGEEYLDFQSLDVSSLDRSKLPSKQIYSDTVVEAKRLHRTLVAAISGIGVAEAIREGYVEEDESAHANVVQQSETSDIFIPDTVNRAGQHSAVATITSGLLNPKASIFLPTNATATNPLDQAKKQVSRPSSSGQGSFPSFPDAAEKSIHHPTNAKATPLPIKKSQAEEFPAWPNTAASPPVLASSTSELPSTQTFNSGAVPLNFPSSSETPKSAFSWPNIGSIQASTSSTTPATSDPGNNLVPTPADKSKFTGFDSTSNASASQLLQPPDASSSTQTFKQPSIFTFPQEHDTKSKQKNQSSDGNSRLTSTSVSQNSLFPLAAPASDAAISRFFDSSGSVSPTSTSNSAFTFDTNQSSRGDPKSDFVSAPSLHAGGGSKVKSSIVDQQTTPAPNSKFSSLLSTTPQSSPQPPSLSQFAFPSVSQTQSSTSKDASEFSKSSDLPKPEIRSSSGGTAYPLSPELTNTAPKPQKAKTVNPQQLAHDAARIGLTQKGGILEHYLDSVVSDIVFKVFREVVNDERKKVLAYLKSRYLSRKFIALWKSITDQRRLRKRAARRRKLLTANIQAEKDKKQREESELARIMEAARISKQLQEQLGKGKREHERVLEFKSKEKDGEEGLNQHINNTSKDIVEANKKRKPSEGDSPSAVIPYQTKPIHKRARTLDSTQTIVYRQRDLSPFQKSRLATPENLVMSRDSSRSRAKQRLDKTQTDYFRLKAMGIDPDTPLVPDTAQSVVARRQRQKEEQEALIARMKTRPSNSSPSATTSKITDMSPLPRPIVKDNLRDSQTSVSLSVITASDDPLLQELRRARQVLNEGTSWLKETAVAFEKEAEEVEARRRSLSRSQSSVDSMNTSTNGFARSTTGIDYVPAALKPGQTLSRTEERIRRTGAHGLATKPIGGTPDITKMGNFSVHGSELRASVESQESTFSRTGTKRGIHEVGEDSTIINDSRKTTTFAEEPSTRALKKPRGGNHQFYSSSPVRESASILHHLGSTNQINRNGSLIDVDHHTGQEEYGNGVDGDIEELEDEEGSEEYDENTDEDDEDDHEQPNSNGQYYLGVEEPVDEDEEEEEDEDENYGHSTHAAQYSSRATSQSVATPATGPGGSAADPFELSD